MIVLLSQDHRLLVEPACGASLAALYDEADFLSGKQTILAIVCGGVGVTISQLEQWESALSDQAVRAPTATPVKALGKSPEV